MSLAECISALQTHTFRHLRLGWSYDAGGQWSLPCLWVVSRLSSSSNACVGSLVTNEMQCSSACLKCKSGLFTLVSVIRASPTSRRSASGEVGVPLTHTQSIGSSVPFADAQVSSRSKCLLQMHAASNFLALVVKVVRVKFVSVLVSHFHCSCDTHQSVVGGPPNSGGNDWRGGPMCLSELLLSTGATMVMCAPGH